jgi:hypothetical protein
MKNTWTKEQWRRAYDLTARGVATAEDVAAYLDHAFTPAQVISKFAANGYSRRLFRDPATVEAPAKLARDLLDDRDARYAASLKRTQTQEFFGDPPPGYSALDRKLQAGRGA